MVHIEIDLQSLRSTRRQVFAYAPIIVGRKDDSCLLLESWRVGLKHAQFIVQDQCLFLEDFGSLQGTRVNDERIKFYGPVQPEDIIIIGPYQIRARLLPTPSSTQASVVCSSKAKNPASVRSPIQSPIPQQAQPAVQSQIQSPGQPPTQQHSLVSSISQSARRPEPQAQQLRTSANNRLKGSDTAHKTGTLACATGVGHQQFAQLLRDYHHHLAVITAIKKKVLAQLDLRQIVTAQGGSAGIKARVLGLAEEALQEHAHSALQNAVSGNTALALPKAQIIDYIVADLCGLGILEPLLKDPEVTEIMVNGARGLFVERAGRCEAVEHAFINETELRLLIERIVTPLGRRVDESMPMVDARLEDGARVHIMLPPVALNGPVITIRKFSQQIESWQDLVQAQSISAELALQLQQLVWERQNILVTGGTSSGKTTLLNILSSAIPREERIITIEDSAELQLPHDNLVRLEARPANAEGTGAISIRDLVRQALRMRPDRIIVGECRGPEAFDMLSAMNTGHEGSLTTLHANSAREALHRLESLVLMAEVGLPFKTVRDYIAMSVHWIIHLSRGADGIRRVQQVSKIVGMEGEVIQLEDSYRCDMNSV